MSIRTIDDLAKKLDDDLIWRKKELSELKIYIDIGKANHRLVSVLTRSGITMMYAHWEGYTKLASRYYLEYIAMQKLKNEQLKSNFLTLSLLTSVNFLPETRRNSEFDKITNFFVSNTQSQAKLPFKTGIDTESNLSSKVLKEIIWCLGLDYSPFQSKEFFIDSLLLGRRNHIAHGQEIDIDIDEYDSMRQTVTELMTTLRDEIENDAVLKKYLKTN
jgi:hypothetical protein